MLFKRSLSQALPLLFLVIGVQVNAQNKNGSFRRVQKVVDEMMYLTSNVVDEVLTYGKAKNIEAAVAALEEEWSGSGRYLDRLEEDEAQMVAVLTESMNELVDLSNGPLMDWANAESRDDFGQDYVYRVGQIFKDVAEPMDSYAAQWEVRTRPVDAQERFDTQQNLVQYTRTLKKSAIEVDSVVAYIKDEIGTTDIAKLRSAQRALVKAISEPLRGYGEALHFNDNYRLWEAYQKYFLELLQLTSADLLTDITLMDYDLVEFNTVTQATQKSALKTMSFYDNEKRLLEKRESRFVKKFLPKAPKR